MSKRPFLATGVGAIFAVLVVTVWCLTFSREDGREYSWYLFPGSTLLLAQIYPNQSIPVTAWYVGAFSHWIVIGAVTDTVRCLIRTSKKKPQ
jgi:hypothetical protein